MLRTTGSWFPWSQCVPIWQYLVPSNIKWWILNNFVRSLLCAFLTLCVPDTEVQQSQPSAKEPLPKLTNRFQLQEVKGHVLSSFSLAGNLCNTVVKGAARVVFPAATALGPGVWIMQNNFRISKDIFRPQTQTDSVNLGSPSRPVENIALTWQFCTWLWRWLPLR